MSIFVSLRLYRWTNPFQHPQAVSSAVRQEGIHTHLCSHLQLHAVSLPGNRLGITVEMRRQGDTQQRGLFMQVCLCMQIEAVSVHS